MIGFDYNQELIHQLQKAVPPIYEPDLNESLRKGKAYLAPGIGFSGGTLGRDLQVLRRKNVDALILLTEWADFKTYPWGEVVGHMKKPVFFDTKNFLDQAYMESCGFQYHSIGRQI